MTHSVSNRPIPQTTYARQLRPLLPKAAFEPDSSKLIILLINAAILLLGWGIAAQLDRWPTALIWLYLPFAIFMGNAVIVLLFVGHDLMHGSVIRNGLVIKLVTLFSQAILWMPPTLWKTLHNRVHHSNTNAVADPDRSYRYGEPDVFGKWAQHMIVPSSTVTSLGLGLGMATAWALYTFRHLAAVLFFNQTYCPHVTAQFSVKPEERRAIAMELTLIVLLHISLLTYLQFDPIKLALAYVLPIGLGYSGMIFYIYTNHLLCPMTEVNDPLMNSVSIEVPKIIDLLHFNFSYHAEHHIFPGLNSNYYPLVREHLATLYPNRMGYVVPAGDAWRLLMETPRHYFDETTFTDWQGSARVNCPSLDPEMPMFEKATSSTAVR
ncbi:MAG: fatty acid desaturase [Elainellaceae cyanobacterium]